MRLGDLDALNRRIDKCAGVDGLGLEPVMAIRDIKALISVIPTIDAIPVEWLKQQFYDNPRLQWAEKCWDVYTGWQKWQRLQKEQGAQ